MCNVLAVARFHVPSLRGSPRRPTAIPVAPRRPEPAADQVVVALIGNRIAQDQPLPTPHTAKRRINLQYERFVERLGIAADLQPQLRRQSPAVNLNPCCLKRDVDPRDECSQDVESTASVHITQAISTFVLCGPDRLEIVRR